MHLTALRPLIALTVLALAACREAAAPGDIPDIAGSWAYSETVTHQSALTCTRVGTLSFEQEQETLVGSYTRSSSCSDDASNPSSDTESGTIRRGQALRGSVEFDLGDCQYRGDATDDRPHRVSGNVLCVTGASATDVSSGSWVAERLTDRDS